MEVRLMMRPRRSFIMRRRHALERRNTEVRFVAMTWSQSSGFIRRSNVSRVIAALLTRMVGMSPAVSSSPMRVSIEAAFPTSRTTPRPLYPCDASWAVSFAAPSGVVEVPMTRAPAPARASAMALPIPREAPVTSATSLLSAVSFGIGYPFNSRQRGFYRRQILERHEFQSGPLLDATVQPREYLARTALDELRDAGGRKRPYRVPPAHRTRQLPHQELVKVGGFLVGNGIHRANERNLRLADLDAPQLAGQAVGGPAHQARVDRHTH